MNLVSLEGDWVSKIGEDLQCQDTWGKNLTYQGIYRIVAHHMDTEAWDNKHYYTVVDDNGNRITVPMHCFNDPS